MSEEGNIILDVGRERFQVRAAAILRQNGHILIHRALGDSFWTLPGGRVQAGETAAEAVHREICEELSVPVRVGELRCLLENFFVYEGRIGHELGLYFDAHFEGPLPFHTSDVVYRVVDGSELEFRWLEANLEKLAAAELKPKPLRELLAGAIGVRHVIYRDQP